MIPDNFSPERIQLINVQALGRASSVFFQGLFDGHPCAVTLPVRFKYVSKAECSEHDMEKLSRMVFDKWLNRLFMEKFEKKIIPYARFRKHFLEYLEKFGTGRKSIFIGLHYAYAKAHCHDIRRIRCIVFPGHEFTSDTLDSIEDFPGQKIIILCRDPRATYMSARSFDCYKSAFMMISVFFGYQFAVRYPLEKNIMFIRHEDLHTEFRRIIRSALEFAGLPYDKCMGHSSFYGYPYTGKSLEWHSTSNLFSSKANRKYANGKWMEGITPLELGLINFFFGGFMRRFNYRMDGKARGRGGYFDCPFGKYIEKYCLPRFGGAQLGFYSILLKISKLPLIGNYLLIAAYLLQIAEGMLAQAVMYFMNRLRIEKLLRGG